MSVNLINILLISRDPRTLQICRNGLEALPTKGWRLVTDHTGDSHVPADLHIWDLESDGDLPNSLQFGEQHQHIFVASRKQLSVLRNRYPGSGYAVLLKPLTEGAFRSVIEQALAGCGSAGSDRDQLLQFSPRSESPIATI